MKLDDDFKNNTLKHAQLFMIFRHIFQGIFFKGIFRHICQAYFSGIFFKLARCGYTLRVTSQASCSTVICYGRMREKTVEPF
jgi:hypothetical protein